MAVNSIKQVPRIILELEAGLDSTHAQIQIRHEHMPEGWVTVVQMLHQALGATLPQAFTQLLQSQKQSGEKRIVLARGMGDVSRGG